MVNRLLFFRESYVLHHIIFITAYAQNDLLQHKRKQWSLTRLANSTFNNARPRAAHSLLMRLFSLSRYGLGMNMISVKYVTDF